MNLEKYRQQLIYFKKHGVKFSFYMGKQWFILKALISGVGIYMVCQQDNFSRLIGCILLGYLVGVVSTNIRSYIIAKARWELQKEVIDWNKVEEI
jgi:hypothetical protein